MDSEGFRKKQSPWYFSTPDTYAIDTQAKKISATKKQTDPTQDSRYPGWAAHMSDGRLVTDYRSKCEVNIPTGLQYATKEFMQKNASDIIHRSRERQLSKTGGGLAYNSIVHMPAARYVKCNEYECLTKKGNPKGLGTERIEDTPSLFGTFALSHPSHSIPAKPMITTEYMGGRNTVRGIFS
jgi:hypothetical protein